MGGSHRDPTWTATTSVAIGGSAMVVSLLGALLRGPMVDPQGAAVVGALGASFVGSRGDPLVGVMEVGSLGAP